VVVVVTNIRYASEADMIRSPPPTKYEDDGEAGAGS